MSRSTGRRLRTAIAHRLCLLTAMLIPASPGWAGDIDAPIKLDIPARSLAEALTQLASQADLQILFSPELVEGKHAEGFAGRYSPREVLDRLLERAGLEFVVWGADTVVVRPHASLTIRRTSQSVSVPLKVLTSADAAAAGERVLEEVVVTAQKREQFLQDVPVSVDVIFGNELAANHVTGLEQMQVLAPSVSFTSSLNTRGQGVSIRGIGTLNFSDGVEPSVATLIDGVVIGRSAGSFFDFNDVERIEILRGPQGTLFGKNASAGAINIVTARPDLEKGELNGAVSYATLAEKKIRGSVSTPLVPGRLALRVSGYLTDADGPIDNDVLGLDVNDRHQWGLRSKLLFNASDALEIVAIGDYAKVNRNCCVSTLRSSLATTQYFGPDGPWRSSLLGSIVPGPANRQVNADAATFLDQETYGASVEMNLDLAGHTLTSISAYRKFHVVDNNDSDALPINLFNVNDANQHQRQLSQELRVASQGQQRIEYVAGLFYFYQDVATITQQQGTFGTLIPNDELLGSVIDRAITTHNAAAFTDGTLRVTERLRLIGGGRLTTERLDARFRRSTMPGAVGEAIGGPPVNFPSLVSDDTNFSYRTGLQYYVRPNVMSFATISRGYKGAAISLLNNLSSEIVSSGRAVLRPEISRNYEIGLRESLPERHLNLNLTAFWTDFKDFQAQSFDARLIAFTLANAGKLRTRGVEIETAFEPTHSLNFTASAAYTDAEIREYVTNCYPGQTPEQGCLANRQDLSGKALNNAPKWAVSMSGAYTRPLGSVPFNAFMRATYSYRSAFNYAIIADPNTEQAGYSLVNLTLGLERHDRRLWLSLFARNLFDENVPTSIGTSSFDSSATGSGYNQILTEFSQRIVGAEVGVRF